MSIRVLTKTAYSDEGGAGAGVALILGEEPFVSVIAKDFESKGCKVWKSKQLKTQIGSPDHASALEGVAKLFKEFSEIPEVQNAEYRLVHPGISFWAERPELASIALKYDCALVAPPSGVLSLFANRLNLLSIADKNGIPHLVSSFDPIQSVREFEKWRKQRPVFPVVIKSTRGIRGLGVLVLNSVKEVHVQFPLWLEQLQLDYGESIVIIEKYKEGARKIVVPFISLKNGDESQVHFCEAIDRSLHSRTTAWIDLCPAPSLDFSILQKLQEWCKILIEKTQFTGVGQFDFLVDGPEAYLIDGLPRLTECYSLVQKMNQTRLLDWQLHTLVSPQFSRPSIPALPSKKQVAMGFRVLSEDVMLQLPCPGRLDARSERTHWEWPDGEADVIYSYGPKEQIPHQSDGVLAYGEMRMRYQGDATQDEKNEMGKGFERLWSASSQVFSELWFAGTLRSSEAALLQLSQHPWVKNGAFHTTFIDEEWVPEYEGIYAYTQLAAQVTIELLTQLKAPPPEKQIWVGSRSFSVSLLTKLPPLKWKGFSHVFEDRCAVGLLEYQGKEIRVALSRSCSGSVFEGQIQVGAFYFLVRFQNQGDRSLTVRSLTAGIIKGLFYLPGQVIPAGETILSMMSLHRLIPHVLPINVRLKKWLVQPEEEVKMGQPLALLEPSDD